MSVKLRFLGGAREVGRNSIHVKGSRASLLLDHGVALNHEPGFPMHIRPRDIDAVILAHAHLDHSGAVPSLYVSRYIPTFATSVTFELVRILVEDFLKLSSYYLPYEYIDLKAMLDHAVELPYGSEYHFREASLKLLDAGHIPGSAQILLDMDGKRVLYTGDFNTVPTKLLDPADQEYGELDAIIVESTYADEDHPDRMKIEEEFVEEIRNVVEGGGQVLIPAFAVGRAQEILCVLEAHRVDWPIAVDGMARSVNEALLDHPSFLNKKLLSSALRHARVVRGRNSRRKTLKKARIIISPSGMLKGGAASYYLKHIAMDQRNAILLVSYQIPGSPGRILLETGKVLIEDVETRVKARVRKFDFSSHCGRTDLQNVLRGLKGNPSVFVIHGDEGNCESLSAWAREELDLNATAPKTGETYEV
ncbi:MAG: MBL fold metallo-hydrolase [Candidatus Bathyarchaeia archaeon]